MGAFPIVNLRFAEGVWKKTNGGLMVIYHMVESVKDNQHKRGNGACRATARSSSFSKVSEMCETENVEKTSKKLHIPDL